MGRPYPLKHFSSTITRQAAWRLAISLGLFVLLLGFSSVQLYRVAIKKAAESRARDLVEYYQTRLAQLDREWELQSRDFRVRIEYTRFFEHPETTALNMQSFMTVLGADRRFRYLIVQDRQGKKLFSHGKNLDLDQIPLHANDERGHYYDQKGNALYVVFEEPIWLGEARGMGRAGFFFHVDNSLLYNLGSPEVTVTALHDGIPIASSKGQVGIDSFQSSAPQHSERHLLSWRKRTEKSDSGFDLVLDAPLKVLFSTTELALGISLIPIVDALILLFTLGFWLMRQARRIKTLGLAVEEFSATGKPTETFIEHTESARRGHSDEISSVAQTIREMAQTASQREAEQRLWAKVYAHSTEAIVITDHENRIISVNRAFTELTGYEQSEIVGQNPRILSTHTHNADFYAQMWQAINEKGRWEGEIKDRRKDGSTYPKWLSVIAIRDEAGKICNYVGIFYDLTERKSREIAESSNLAKSQFLSSMSHELRTPMNAILGYAQLMKMNSGLQPEQRENLEEILNAGQHLLELINDVLDLSRIESGRLELMLEAVDPRELAEECISLLAPAAQSREIQLVLDFSNVVPGTLIIADRTRFKQVMLNLLSNAIKYNLRQGCVTLQMRQVDNDLAHIVVRDTGSGIAPEKQAELFQPFKRLGMEQSAIEGTGIGLVICKRLVEAMGGRIGVESQLGVGSSFWVELKIDRHA